jgi:hypothetical protein
VINNSDLSLSTSVLLLDLFNSSSFLTAGAQSEARKNEGSVDQTVLAVEVTKKQENEIDLPRIDGAYVHGLFLESARCGSK